VKKVISILFLFSLISSCLFAQKFTAQASKNKLAVGETFQITYTLNTSGSGFKAPPLFDFDVYGGPNQSQSMSIMNGNVSQSISWSFILAAKKEGKFTIAPASITVNGNKIESNSLNLEIVKGSGGNTNSNPNSSGNPNVSSPSTNENVGDNLFIKTIVNKTKAYLGEQISVTHKVYTRYQMKGFQDIKFPDYTGFWSQDVPNNNQQLQVTTENVDGVNYYVAELKRTFIFPQRTGKIQIEPLSTEVVVRKKSNRQPRDIFEQMMGVGYEDVVYSIKSNTTTIEVNPLPIENKPIAYNGAVGDFSFKAQLSKDKVKENDAINLTITLSGKGNIKLIEPPKIEFPEDFEVYDPKISEKIATTGSGVMGTKTFDFLIVPRHQGDYKIDKLSFTYFDSQKKEYITIPSPEFLIHVDKGDASTATANVYTRKSKEEIKVLGEDIKYIKTQTALNQKDDYFFGSVLFYVGWVAPLLSFLLLLFFRKKQIKDNSDLVSVKSRKATKLAKKQLALAEKHLKQNSSDLFFVEVSKALYDYVSNKFNIPLAELNKDNITHNFVSKNVSEETINDFVKTIDACEYAKYAPGAVTNDLQSVYDKTVELISKIENEIK
jgi:hypothetical protein